MPIDTFIIADAVDYRCRVHACCLFFYDDATLMMPTPMPDAVFLIYDDIILRLRYAMLLLSMMRLMMPAAYAGRYFDAMPLFRSRDDDMPPFCRVIFRVAA